MIRILWSLKLTVLTEAAEAWDARDGDPRLDLAVGARETAGLASPRFIDASLSQRSSSSRTSFSIWSRFKSLSPCSPRPFCWRKQTRPLRRERTVLRKYFPFLSETTLSLYLIWFQVRIWRKKVYLNMKTQLFFLSKISACANSHQQWSRVVSPWSLVASVWPSPWPPVWQAQHRSWKRCFRWSVPFGLRGDWGWKVNEMC